ncbi:MAG: hypothetical protein N3A38_13735, partial [Planctomycetota bacterium]|nr:hypothetical protein [Planctomycetota bacterium]
GEGSSRGEGYRETQLKVASVYRVQGNAFGTTPTPNLATNCKSRTYKSRVSKMGLVFLLPVDMPISRSVSCSNAPGGAHCGAAAGKGGDAEGDGDAGEAGEEEAAGAAGAAGG